MQAFILLAHGRPKLYTSKREMPYCLHTEMEGANFRYPALLSRLSTSRSSLYKAAQDSFGMPFFARMKEQEAVFYRRKILEIAVFHQAVVSIIDPQRATEEVDSQDTYMGYGIQF